MQPYRVWFIQDLIEKNKRIFIVPVYQRNYDWNHTQCEILYNDIITAFIKDKKHFTGTVVYIKGQNSSSVLDECLIIDGQQRITTIFLMLKVLYDIAHVQNESVISELGDYLFNRNCDMQFKLKLKPVKGDNNEFEKLMSGSINETDASSNLVRNYKLIEQLVHRSLAEGKSIRDILRGMKHLEIVEIVLDPSQGDDPQTIFESINSTGLELSLADLVRNFLLMNDRDQESLYLKYWLPIENAIGNDNLADYLIHFLNMKLSDSIVVKNAYEKFKNLFKDNNYTHQEMLDELKTFSIYFAAFIGKENNYSNNINHYLLALRLLDQSTFYPFMFRVFQDHKLGQIDNTVLEKVLRLLRSYSIRRIICEVPSNSLKGLFKTLYSRVYKESVNYTSYYDELCKTMITIKSKDKMPSDNEFRESLIFKNLYSKKKACKFLLASIENEGFREQIYTDNLSIEHILPQKLNSAIWRLEIGNDYNSVYDTYLHTLGNLTITGSNSELGTKPFSEKKRIIIENSKANRLNRLILSSDRWNEQRILERARELAEFTLNIFSFEKIDISTNSQNEFNENQYNLNNIDDVVNTKPINFTFMGEINQVNSYATMLAKIIELLHSLDSNIFIQLAKNRFMPTSTDRVYITFDSNELRKAAEIDNTGIFYEKNLSSIGILNFIKRLIEECQLDPDDFEFECAAK